MKVVAPIAIVLDTSPLGLLTQRPGHPGGDACKLWAAALDQAGCLFFVPEIADYELRREFVRLGNAGAIRRLDFFNASVTGEYLPLTTPAVRMAADLWARVRNHGKTTAPPEASDADALIAAQASLLDPAAFGLSAVVAATANVGHLSTLTKAVLWGDIRRDPICKERPLVKRTAIFLGLAIFCLAAAGYRPMLVAMERHRRHDLMLAAERNFRPLILDAATTAILAGADRVETFRLDDFHEAERRSEAESESLKRHRSGTLDNHMVLRVGTPQGKNFAAALHAALSQTPSAIGADGRMSLTPSCFDPGVGFRVWKGAAYVDLCVCFYCSGVEIVTQDAEHKIASQQTLTLGRSRAAFLALSRQAFPQDAALAAIKDQTQ